MEPGAGEQNAAPHLHAAGAGPETDDWRLSSQLIHSQVTAVRINMV